MKKSPHEQDYGEKHIIGTSTYDIYDKPSNIGEKTNFIDEEHKSSMMTSEGNFGDDATSRISKGNIKSDIKVKWNPISSYIKNTDRIYKANDDNNAIELIQVYKDGRWTFCNDKDIYAAIDMDNVFLFQINIEYSTRFKTIM